MSHLELRQPTSDLQVAGPTTSSLETLRRHLRKLSRLLTQLKQEQVVLARQIDKMRVSVNENKDLRRRVALLQTEKATLLIQMGEIAPELARLQSAQHQLEHQIAETEEQTRHLLQLRTQLARKTSSARSSGFMTMSLLGGLDRHELLAMVHDMIISEVRQQHFALSNLYATNFRLYEALDRASVLSGILETVVNLIGSEQVAVFEVNVEHSTLDLGSSFGIEAESYRQIPIGSGLIGQVALTGTPYFEGNDLTHQLPEESDLTACIPLKIGSAVIGVVAIFRLLPQKARFVELDFKLFELLTTHAAMALHCSTIYTNCQ